MKELMMLTTLALAFATTSVLADGKEPNQGESARGEQKAELKKEASCMIVGQAGGDRP